MAVTTDKTNTKNVMAGEISLRHNRTQYKNIINMIIGASR
jgi:hypothetical protein